MFFIIFKIITISFVSGCNKVKYFEYEDFNHGIKIIAASDEVKSREDLILPDEIDGKIVHSIEKFVFENSKMKSVTIPKNTITIEESAFLKYILDKSRYVSHITMIMYLTFSLS